MKNFSSKPLLLVAILMLLQVVAFKTVASTNTGYKPGQTAPDFKLKSLDGKSHTLTELRKNGHVMLVFWAVECVYCYAHVKDLNALQKKYNGKGLTIVAINIGAEYNDDVAEYVKDNNIKYLVLANRLDNLDVGEAYHSVVTPTIVLVAPGGTVEFYGHTLPKLSDFIK